MSRLHKYLATLDKNFLELLRKVSASLIVKVVGTLLALFVSLSLGRLIGPEGLGLINLSNRIISILLLIGLFGARNVIVRNVSINYEAKHLEKIADTMFTSSITCGAITIVVAIPLLVFSRTICNSIFNEPLLVYPLRIALAAMIFQIISRIYSSGLVGLKKIWQSNLVDQSLSYFISAILLTTLYLSNFDVSVIAVAVIFAVSRITVTASILIFWKRLFPSKIKKKLITKQLLKKSFPLFLATMATTIINNLDLIVLGIFNSMNEVGIYSVAAQLATLPRMLLLAVNSALSPSIAILFEAGKINEMEKLVQRTILTISAFAAFIFVMYLAVGELVLQLWGKNFSGAFPVLIVLSLGHLFNLSTGPTGIIMVMCGLEKIHRNQQTLAMIFCIGSSILLAFYYGIIGVAIAQALTIIINNTARMIIVRWKLGIMIFPTSLSVFSK